MPEGDTVHLSARRMHAALAGRALVIGELRVPRFATTDLAGRTVVEVLARGKHMLTRLDGGSTLHTHFGMDGTWRLHRAGRGRPGPGHQVRAVLANRDWVAIGLRLVVVELVATDAEADVVGHLGPDLLGPDWDAEEAVRRLAARPDRAVGEAVLDQRNLAGIGNLYKSELLFLRGVHPRTPVAEAGDLRELVELARRLLAANADRFEQVTTGDLRRGHQHYVYGRAGQPCRRCTTPIARAEQGDDPLSERVTFWCPSCQPRGAQRDGGAIGG